MKIQHVWKMALLLFVMMGLTQQASAQHVGLLSSGGIGNAASNVAYFVSENPGYTWESVDNTTLNAMTVAQMNSTFDILIVPWTISSGLNMDWATRLLPFLTAGGNVLWEDPANTSDLVGSGLTFGGSYTSSDIILVPPYDANGAEGYFHVHYTIASHNEDWTPFSVDADGGVHGVVGEFGAGRMVLGVSDNLYHADFATDPATYNFMINETNFVLTGSVSGSTTGPATPIPTLGQWAVILLTMLLGLVGVLTLSRRKLLN